MYIDFYLFILNSYLCPILAQNICVGEVLAGDTLAPAQCLWTTEASGSVRLRIDDNCPQEPITVHQMFITSVQKYGSLFALATKRNGKWEKITFSEYYQCCRMAAKSFLKVICIIIF